MNTYIFVKNYYIEIKQTKKNNNKKTVNQLQSDKEKNLNEIETIKSEKEV